MWRKSFLGWLLVLALTACDSGEQSASVVVSTSPEVATAYGLSSEQVLYIVTSVELDKEAFYLFKNKRYQIRFQAKNGSRLFYSTFIEVKEDSDV